MTMNENLISKSGSLYKLPKNPIQVKTDLKTFILRSVLCSTLSKELLTLLSRLKLHCWHCVMASATAPALFSCAVWIPARAPDATKSTQRMSVKITHARTWPLHISGRRPMVFAEYRRGGGAGDFVAGFLLGGAVFGALGYLLAPQISKSLEEVDSVKEDGTSPKRPARFLEDDEGLEKTRRNLNEKIAQLNAAIDDVSAQLRSEEGFGIPNDNNVELESPA